MRRDRVIDSSPTRRRRPSAALVVSIVALVVALSGTGFAASHFIVSSSSQVKPGAIKGKNIAKKTVKLSNLAQGARPKSGPQGPQGPAGPAGAAGAPGAATLPPAIGARALLSTPTRDVPTTTVTTVKLEIVFDTGGFYKPAAADDRLFAPKAGVYTVTAGVAWEKIDLPNAIPDNARLGAEIIHRSGTSFTPSVAFVVVPYQDNTPSAQSMSGVVRLEEGDSVGVQAFHDAGGTLKMTSADKLTYLALVYNGP